MKILHQGYKQIVRGLRRFQHRPPTAVSIPQELLEQTQLVCDRLELLKRLPAGGSVAECGVDQGDFSMNILELCNPDELVLVDLWGTSRFSESKYESVRTKFGDRVESGKVKIIRKASMEALAEFPDHSLSWIYIDTNHSYSTTRDELRLAAKKVKVGGYICGHDYTVGTWESYIRFGVIEAVNEFCVEQSWRMAMLTNEPRRHLSFALRQVDQT